MGPLVLCALSVIGLPVVAISAARRRSGGRTEVRCQTLETIACAVRRGVAIDPQTLLLVAEDLPQRHRRPMVRAAHDLERGLSLATALSGALDLTPEDTAAIEAAEGTPQLTGTLRAAARADRERFVFRRRLLVQLAYPAIVLTFLGGFVGIGVAPKMQQVCASMDIPTADYLRTFDLARAAGLSLAVLAVIAALACASVFDAPLRALRGLRRRADPQDAAGWLRALSVAVRAGRPLHEALERTAPAIGHARHGGAVLAAAQRVAGGASVAAVWDALPLPRRLRGRGALLCGPPEAVAGALVEISEDAADHARRRRERVLLVVTPVLLSLSGAVVCAVFLGLFDALHRLREAALW